MLKFLDENIEGMFIVPIMLGMSLLIFVQVVMRYVFNSSLVWSEELARYLFIWLVYFSVSYTAKKEKHIRIEVAIKVFPKKIRPYVDIFSEVVILGFSLFVVVASFTIIDLIKISGQHSPAMGIPMYLVYAAPFVGFMLTSIRSVQTIVKKVKNISSWEVK